MRTHILTLLLVVNVLFIAAINEKYIGMNGFWVHVGSFLGFLGLLAYAITSTARQRLVLIFFSAFLVFNLGYHWLNETVYSLIRLNFFQAGELYFDLSTDVLKQAFQDYKLTAFSYLTILILLANTAFLFIKVPARLKLAQPQKPMIEVAAASVVLAAWFLYFPAVTHTYQKLVQTEKKHTQEIDTSLLKIIEKLDATKGQGQKFVPTLRRVKENIGWFDATLLDDKIIYYSTNCDQTDLQAIFYVHYFPKKLQDIPKKRQKYKFDNVHFRFNKQGIKVKNLCYIEQPLPSYSVVRYRTGQHIPKKPNLWSAVLE